jgi:hypothetical protein
MFMSLGHAVRAAAMRLLYGKENEAIKVQMESLSQMLGRMSCSG